MDDFVVRAALAGLAVAAVAGPLGAFIVWRRMAYFGDALSHSALLGVALGLLIGVAPNIGVIAVCCAVAVGLVVLQRRPGYAGDTLLGIMAHGTLSLGLVVATFLETLRVDLMRFLFGDVLAVTGSDLAWIYGGGAVVLVALVWLWRPLLSVTVHEDLARVEGVPVTAVKLAFMVMIAVVIAIAMKIVGVVLITSLLIIPAATARRFAGTPESMALLAVVAGCLAVGGGLWGSLQWDTPAGPSIVVAATALFLMTVLLPDKAIR